MLPVRLLPVFAVLLSLCFPIHVGAGVLEEFLREDELALCGIERYEDAYETTCAWDQAARAAGNCNAPQYQEVVGKRGVFRRCRTLFGLGVGSPLPAVAPPEAPAAVKATWILLKAIQPLAAEAIAAPPPICFPGIKPYIQRTQKADHIYFFSCMNDFDKAVSQHMAQSHAGAVVRAIEQTLATADMQNVDTAVAADELALLLEDEGNRVDQKAVDELLARFK